MKDADFTLIDMRQVAMKYGIMNAGKVQKELVPPD